MGGQLAGNHARARGVALADLPDIWAGEWDAHLAECRRVFRGNPRFVTFDLDSARPADYRAALAPWFSLGATPPVPAPADLRTARMAAARAAVDLLDGPPLPAPVPAAPAHVTAPLPPGPARTADLLAQACLGRLDVALPSDAAGLSSIYARWDGGAAVTDRTGAPHPLARRPEPSAAPFTGTYTPQTLQRVVGVLNDITALDRARAIEIDMQDARLMNGRAGGDSIARVWGPDWGRPLLTYCRRAGAPNLILWPLPGLHTPGSPGFVPDRPVPGPDWSQRLDRAAWRGDLSGNAWSGGRRGRGTPAILRALRAARGPAARAEVLDELHSVPRVAFLRSHQGRGDIDAGLVLSRLLQGHAGDPAIAPLLAEARPLPWLVGHRYVVSLQGYDTASNFLPAAAGGSLVLKEADGWEVYYSALFRPWEHYVPLGPAGCDLVEKLDWARGNPARVAAMVAAAQAACTALDDPAIRAGMMHRIMDAIPQA